MKKALYQLVVLLESAVSQTSFSFFLWPCHQTPRVRGTSAIVLVVWTLIGVPAVDCFLKIADALLCNADL